ncbi:MAG: F0F1 ATP synthase subunit A, partial [Pseudomonadota bacterium]
MAVHFNWTQMIPGVDHSNTHIATAAVVTVGLILFSLAGRAALGTGENAVVPAGRFSIKGIF